MTTNAELPCPRWCEEHYRANQHAGPWTVFEHQGREIAVFLGRGDEQDDYDEWTVHVSVNVWDVEDMSNVEGPYSAGIDQEIERLRRQIAKTPPRGCKRENYIVRN